MARSSEPPPSDDGTPEEPNESGDYEVGYRKPPRHTRFGFGNKMGRGRRKGSRNIGAIFNEVAAAKVATKVNGKVRKLTKREILMGQLVNSAVKGDLKAIAKVLDLEERYGPREDAASLTAEEQQRDREALAAFLAMRQIDEENDNG